MRPGPAPCGAKGACLTVCAPGDQRRRLVGGGGAVL